MHQRVVERPYHTARACCLAKAFTLVELLVVIAIISALAGLLLPALSRAIEAARSIACVNSEKQIAVSVHAYASDSTGIVPAANMANNGTYWHTILREWYMDNDTKVWRCRSRKDNQNGAYDTDYGWNFGGDEAYGYKGFGYCTYKLNNTPLDKSYRGWPVRLALVHNPSMTYMFGEAREDFGRHTGYIGTQRFNGQPQVPPWSDSTNQQDAYPVCHQEGMNIGFADAHVGYQSQVFMASDEATPMWTRTRD